MSVRSPYNARLKQAKQDLNRYKKLSKDLHAQSSRNDLLGGTRFKVNNSDDPYGERSDRQRLLAGTETLNDGSRRLQDAQRIALESEEAGADILRTLHVQREQIENSRGMVSRVCTAAAEIQGY
jgi:vesicle transport through interaction with t-SNAREs 1